MCRRKRPSTSRRGSRTISRPPSTARRWCIPTSSPASRRRRAATARSNGRSASSPTSIRSSSSYCNTIPTPDGGTHESGLRSALTKGIKDHAERTNQGKRAAAITSDDVMAGAACMLSVFIREPEFQGQTKDRLATNEATRIVENAIKDPFDHWLAANQAQASKLLDFVDRARRRAHPPQAGKGNLAQERGAQAPPPRQARRLHLDRRRRRGAVHRRGRLGGRLRQAGARPRNAGDPAAARQDPQRRLGRPRQARAEPAALGPGAGARLRHRRALPRAGPALRAA